MEVINETRRSYYDHFYKINPQNLTRSKNKYHLDHIYSISQGFKQNIDPKIIGHWTNLRMLLASENIRKNWKSDKTLKELLEDYESKSISL